MTIGANCYIDGATIGDNVVIGNGASLYKDSVIESGSFIAAGSVVAPGTKIMKNQLWAGNPAKYLRDVKPEEKDAIAENRDELIELGHVLVEETEKSQHEIMTDRISNTIRSLIPDSELVHLEKNMISYSAKVGENDDMGVESLNEGYDDIMDEGKLRSNKLPKDYAVNMKYEQDFRTYPEYFKIYTDNYKKFEEINRNEENLSPGEARDIFEDYKIKPTRAGAMRAWAAKWDSDFNTTFKNVGSQVEQSNK